jgi:hypothetical protein
MKKVIIIAAIISGLGVFTSCTKQSTIKTPMAFYASPALAKRDIGWAD